MTPIRHRVKNTPFGTALWFGAANKFDMQHTFAKAKKGDSAEKLSAVYEKGG